MNQAVDEVYNSGIDDFVDFRSNRSRTRALRSATRALRSAIRRSLAFRSDSHSQNEIPRIPEHPDR